MNPLLAGVELETLLAHWRLAQESKKLAERTISERAANVRAYLKFSGEHPLKITPDGIVRFIARPGLSPNTAVTYHASIRAYCAWLVRTRRRKTDPSSLTERPKKPASEPRPVELAELRRMMRVVNRRRTRIMVLLAAFAGLRVHEIAKIRGEDFDPTIGSLLVTGKGGKTARMALEDALVGELAEMPITGWWFPGYGRYSDRHITSRAVSHAISGVMRRAGIYNGKPHQLRHFYGTTLVEAGVNLRIVQKLMRHTSVASTQIYTGVSFDQQHVGANTLKVRALLDSLHTAA